MGPNNFTKLNAELGAEFDRYVAEHPAWAQKHIPHGAKVALQIEGNAAFNAWSRQLAPVRSRIIKATVLKAA